MCKQSCGRMFISSAMLSVHLLETFLHLQSKLYLNIFQMKLFTLGLVLGSASAQFQGRVQGRVQGNVQRNVQDNQAGFMNEVDFGGFMQNSPAGKTSFIQIFSQIYFCFKYKYLFLNPDFASSRIVRAYHSLLSNQNTAIHSLLTNQSTV